MYGVKHFSPPTDSSVLKAAVKQFDFVENKGVGRKGKVNNGKSSVYGEVMFSNYVSVV